MDGAEDNYLDAPVRLYVITGGRVRPSRNTIRPETLLAAADPGGLLPPSAVGEARALLEMCQGALSLAEAAAHLQLPVSVVSVVASDLIDDGHLTMGAVTPYAGPDRSVLEKVLNGLRKL
jgi:hypothetical protein